MQHAIQVQEPAGGLGTGQGGDVLLWVAGQPVLIAACCQDAIGQWSSHDLVAASGQIFCMTTGDVDVDWSIMVDC